MNMLTPQQTELLHREADGENTSEESAEVRVLVESQPEALALLTGLRELDALFRQVPDRAPPAGLEEAIRNAIPVRASASPQVVPVRQLIETFTRWAIQQWDGATNFMEEVMNTKKALIIATSAFAAIAIIGYAIGGYPPKRFDPATIGAGDDMPGVQQAGRYRGRSMTEADVSLSNPEIQALFQNHDVLKLVQSNAFREAMRDDSFRALQSSDAFRQLESSAAYRELQRSDAFLQMQKSEAFRALEQQDAFRALGHDEAMHSLQANEAYRQLEAKESFRAVLKSDAFREVMAKDAFRAVMAKDAFRAVMAKDAFRAVLATDAFRQLEASDSFRALSRSQSLSEAFLSQAMRMEQ
jgi:hypothetical protein